MIHDWLDTYWKKHSLSYRGQIISLFEKHNYPVSRASGQPFYLLLDPLKPRSELVNYYWIHTEIVTKDAKTHYSI